MEKGLEVQKAYKVIRGDDKRPLLILREFSTFDDPLNEKLSRKLYTEKTVLLTHWFYCVRLPHHVTEEDHPFHNLFKGNNPPQLMLASNDGANVYPFEFKTARSDLLKSMLGVLDTYYVKSPKKSVDSLIKLLPKFDKSDKKIQDLKEQVDRSIEKLGPRAGKTKKLMRDLEKEKKAREKLDAKKKALRKLLLKDGGEVAVNQD